MCKRYTLDNGIRVILKKISYVRSVSVGYWIESGSIYENQYNNGTSHFIEHMLFKGTKTRTAKEIANTIDQIGGQINAFTSKECTCYYVKVLDTHINTGIDILSDMLLNSIFDEKEINKEKSVIIEEINMYEDSPEDVVYDLISKTIFKEHPLGLPILGTIEPVSNINRNSITDYMEKNYTSERIVISVAGSFDEEKLLKELNLKIGQHTFPKHPKSVNKKPEFHSGFSSKYKDIEQIHVCIAYKGIPYDDQLLYPILALNNILGGSMSSRLFQTIREDHGLTYSIYTHPTFYNDIGLFTIYFSINPNQIDKTFKLLEKEIRNLKNKPFTNEELQKSKEQLKGNYILGLESTSSIMNLLGKSELFKRNIYTQNEILKKIDNIKIEDLINLVNTIFSPDCISMSVVGKIREKKMENMYNILREINLN